MNVSIDMDDANLMIESMNKMGRALEEIRQTDSVEKAKKLAEEAIKWVYGEKFNPVVSTFQRPEGK